MDLENIITPVQADELEKYLKDTGYDEKKTEFLVTRFKEGFDLGYRGEEKVQMRSPNLKFFIGDKVELWNKVMKEVETGRYAGPFKEIPFDNFIQSPIGLVPKDGGSKTRLIFHLSFPKNESSSVNANTPKELSTVKYQDFDDAVRIILNEERLTADNMFVYLGKSNLSHAFRNLPMNKKFWRYLVMKAQSPFDDNWYYFIDKCLPFGVAISCAVFQAFSDALSHIIQFYTGKENVNYLDDYLFIAFLQALCDDQLNLFIQVCETIHFPISIEKTLWGTTQLEFLGLLLDTKKRVIGIPVKKVEKAIDMLTKIKSKKKATLRDMEQLCGFLNFLNKSVVRGRTFMRRMYTYGRHLTKRHHHFQVDTELKMDIDMWLEFLKHPSVYSRSFFDMSYRQYFSTLNFYTDASSLHGCGGVHNDEWFLIPWDEDFITMNELSINYLELYALTVGVMSWLKDEYQGKNLVIFCDNQSVIHMVNQGISKCRNCMILIRSLVLHCMIYYIKLKVKYVRSSDNTYADYLSRMMYGKFRKLARINGDVFRSQPIQVPDDLWPMDKLWMI